MGETPVENLIQELIDAVNRNAQISGWEILTSICSVISLVAIVILLIERKEKKRPYLQITFLVYISETDELRKAIKSMDSNIVKIGRKIEKALKIDTSSQVQTTSFARLQDEYLRTIVTGIPKQQANPGESDLSCDSSEKN